ncbi:MAG: hypothetical protein A2W19_03475 [Spirochaetes bacterium RBG_16_49_21]|nr:MAG: hypothetical protein A2W19_03475 [Spirochaetes bacterium RBG_16_49_21]
MTQKKILIIEDEPIIALNILNLLEMKGYMVAPLAANGKEAVDLALEHKPDLILADIMLPGDMDGISAVEEIQKARDIPVVYLTAHSNEALFGRAKATRPYGYLIKPLNQSDIHSTVDLALHKHEMESRLKISEARYRTLVDNSLNGIAIYEAVGNGDDFIILDFNRSAELMENIRRRDVVGRSVREVFPGVTEFGLFDVFREVWETGVPRSHPVSLYKDERLAGWRENFVFKLPSGEIASVYRDETKRKQAEKALQLSTRLNNEIISNAKIGIIVYDCNLNYVLWNRFMQELTGLSPEQVLGKNALEFFPFLTQHGLERIIKQALLGETVHTPVLPFRVPATGESVWLQYIYSPHRDAGNNIIGVIGLVSNVTENIRAGFALLKSEKNYRELVENSNSIIFMRDIEGKITYLNKFAQSFFGYDKDEIVGKNVVGTIVPEYESTGRNLADMIREISRDADQYAVNVNENMCKSGERVWIAWTNKAIRDEDGAVREIMCIGNDITQRKRIEEALRESEVSYRSLAENIPAIVYRLFLSDGRRIQFYNNMLEILTGFNPDELHPDIMFSIDPLILPEDRGLAAAARAEALHNKTSFEVNYRMRHKNGTLLHFLEKGSPVYDDTGNPLSIDGVIFEISGQKQTEQKIRESLLEKEILIKEIHHRVKNNMQIISSLLSLQSIYVCDDKDLELFKDCYNRVRSMALVHEMLYQSEDLAHIDFKVYIEQMAEQLFIERNRRDGSIQFKSDVRNIQLNINSAIPCALIINELLTNSLKYAFPEDGRGTISLSFKKNPGGIHTLVIGDNGIGLPEDMDISDSKTLGLQLVNELVKQLRGKLSLDRKKGTRFTITFGL